LVEPAVTQNCVASVTNKKTEVVEAIEAIEADEIIEAAEVLMSGKSLMRTSESSRF
jgi:hypothetical protein